MQIPPLSRATARLFTVLSVGTMALCLLLLVVDPNRVVTSQTSPKRNLHLWVDGSLSMRASAAEVESFIQRARALRHLDVQVHLLTPDVTPAPRSDLKSAMVGAVSGGWAAARAFRRATGDEVHVLLSDFRWPPGDPSLSGMPPILAVSVAKTDPPAGVHVEHRLSQVPLLAGEGTRAEIRTKGGLGSTLRIRHGSVTTGHPASAALVEQREALTGDDFQTVELPFTPAKEGFYYIETRIEGPGGESARDHLLLEVAPAGLSLEVLFCQADYGARDLADLLSGYGAFQLKRHTFLRPGTEAEWKARLDEAAVDPAALWLLFAPPAELVNVARARARGLIWFPMGRAQAVTTLWPEARTAPATATTFPPGPFRGPGEGSRAASGIQTMTSLPKAFFDTVWEGEGDRARVGRKGALVFAGLSPMPALPGDGLARGLRAMVLSLHGHLGKNSGTLRRRDIGDLANFDPRRYGRFDVGAGPLPASAFRNDIHRAALLENGGVFWGDGKDGRPDLISWRLPLGEDPAFTAPLATGVGVEEGLRRLEKENRPSPVRTFTERRALAGPWVAVPFFLALILFVWARYAPVRVRGR